MAARDSILLIVKQSGSLDYNTLLNRIASNYGSINSARAALSRTLKDLNAFGLIQRRKDRIYITNKGAAQISLEMKAKLLTKLNQSMKSQHSHLEIDTVVKNLHTLIERSKKDADLLKAAKGSTDFFLKDLRQVSERIRKRAEHLDYLNKVFENQIKSLEGLGFNDLASMELNGKNIKAIQLTAEKAKVKDFTFQSTDKSLMEKLGQEFKAKKEKQTLTLPIKAFSKLADSLKDENELLLTGNVVATAFLPGLTLKMSGNKLHLIAPSAELSKWTKSFQ